jgi:hypothetical protein
MRSTYCPKARPLTGYPHQRQAAHSVMLALLNRRFER